MQVPQRYCTPVWFDAYNALQDTPDGKYYVDREIHGGCNTYN